MQPVCNLGSHGDSATVDLGQISSPGSTVCSLKIYQHFLSAVSELAFHSDTRHDINPPGEQKCEAGLPHRLLLLFSPAQHISQRQPSFSSCWRVLLEYGRSLLCTPPLSSFSFPEEQISLCLCWFNEGTGEQA